MAKLARQERVKGAHKENEDWWRLVFDTEAKRSCVEHKWSLIDAGRAARSNKATAEFDINGFLAEGEASRKFARCKILCKSLTTVFLLSHEARTLRASPARAPPQALVAERGRLRSRLHTWREHK
jgi:hypothetical protein